MVAAAAVALLLKPDPVTYTLVTDRLERLVKPSPLLEFEKVFV